MQKPPKLAQRTAELIEREILDGRLPAGWRLGTEPELIERYGVSRAVLREAIRIVERHQVAETRRGTGGGLFVAQPAEEAVAQVLAAYLESIGLEFSELFEARRALESELIRCAAIRARKRGVAELEQLLLERPDPIAFADDASLFEQYYAQLGLLARSPALGLFVRALHQVSQHVAHTLGLGTKDAATAFRTAWKANLSIARAIRERDVEQAQSLSAKLLRRQERDVVKRRPRPQRPSDLAKRGDVLASQLRERIWQDALQPGDHLGSEALLVEHYDVSRAALREAIRLLEQHGIAEMRRGLGGGLVVSEPDPGAVIRSASVYLAHLDLPLETVKEVRLLLEPLGASLAAEHASEADLAELTAKRVQVLTQKGARGRLASREIHEFIADLSRNRALALFTRVMIASAWGTRAAAARELPEDALDVLRSSDTRIVGAIHEHDARRAQQLMSNHVQVTFEWWAARRSR